MEQAEHSVAQAIACRDSCISSLAQASNVLSDWAELIIAEVPRMSEDKLIETARIASELERHAFRVRGACAAELKRRIRTRVRLNPSSRGVEESSICKQMAKLANEIGVSQHTLNDDSRIFETFGDRFGVDTELGREYYRLALAAPDPQEAIELAATKLASQANYSMRDFRRDVAELNAGKPEREVEELHWMTLRLDAEAWADLQTVKARFGCDAQTAVTLGLRALSDDAS